MRKTKSDILQITSSKEKLLRLCSNNLNWIGTVCCVITDHFRFHEWDRNGSLWKVRSLGSQGGWRENS